MLAKRIYNKRQLLAIQNYIECEAHRELVLAGIQGDKFSMALVEDIGVDQR